MTDMIEKVARAIEVEKAKSFDETIGQRYEYRIAKAAIAAMREPTEAMEDAGQEVREMELEGQWATEIFKAMIDTSLEEEKDDD